MTKSAKSIFVVIRLDFMGDDVRDHVISDAVDNMVYSFEYEDQYIKLIDSEVVDSYTEHN